MYNLITHKVLRSQRFVRTTPDFDLSQRLSVAEGVRFSGSGTPVAPTWAEPKTTLAQQFKLAQTFCILATPIDEDNTGICNIFGTIIGLEIFWYCLVALVISQPAVKNLVMSFMHWIERITGVILILLGLRLAFAKSSE